MLENEILIHNLPMKDIAAIEKTIYTLKKREQPLTNEERDWMDWAELRVHDYELSFA